MGEPESQEDTNPTENLADTPDGDYTPGMGKGKQQGVNKGKAGRGLGKGKGATAMQGKSTGKGKGLSGGAGKTEKAKGMTQSKRADLTFPVGRIHKMMKNHLMSKSRVSGTGAVYFASVLEYLCAEILHIAMETASV
eukprot:TRINITY_DN7677_c0_g1_i2.p1 TRINITY_DN7677_c0_g1~~TRINITY_DN7677_c0_g1_i2.p1  ORF type:complete len:160 (+),score=52.58 TRINITY_DN7677_c0_g1_i2:71-481(+)